MNYNGASGKEGAIRSPPFYFYGLLRDEVKWSKQ